MPVRSLADMARAVAIRNAQRITDLGEMEYDLAKPILKHVENPEKLVSLDC
jgi:hypothetical protein